MLRRMTRGFTLVELLIVACILAILVALLMPAMGQAWVVADNTRCTTNLYRISQAVGMRSAEEGMGIKTGLKARYWCAQLLPYLERKTDFLLCPVPNVVEVSTWQGEGSEAVTDGGGQMTWDGGAFDQVATDEAAFENSIQLTDLAEHKVITGSGTTYYTPLEEGRWCVKFSNEQYVAAQAQGLLGDADSANYLRTKSPCVYNPGSNSRQYWLCIEDHGGDEDYKDVMIHVTENEDGSINLDLRSGSTGYANSIVSLPDHNELSKVPKNTTGGLTVTLKDETGGSSSSSGGGSFGSFGGGAGGTELTADTGGSATTNYGMNANFADLAGKAGKIAVMDYHRYQVRPDADVWSDPEIDPNADGIPVFARHWKKVNVLFTDGSVSLMDAKDIDPNVPSLEDKYWKP